MQVHAPKKRSAVTVVALALLLTLPVASALPIALIDARLPRFGVTSVNCSPPGSGDWVISSTVSCVDEELVVAGNVLVQAGGILELEGTTLSIDSPAADGYDLHAYPGATLYLNDSALHSTDVATYFAL